MTELNKKVNQFFPGKAVRKDLVRKVKVGANIPVYVLEYLLGKYCATDEELAIHSGLDIVNAIISKNVINPDESNKAKSWVKEKGEYTLIDKAKVRLVSSEDKYWAELVNFNDAFFWFPSSSLGIRTIFRMDNRNFWPSPDFWPPMPMGCF
jgi:ATP-dependent Lon protease